MYGFISYFNNLFKIALQVSITASFLIGLILMIRKLSKGKLGVKFQYALWFILLLRLLIPELPKSSFSIFNLTSKIKEIPSLLFAVRENTLGNVMTYSGEKISYICNQGDMLSSLASMNLNSSNVTSFNWSILDIITIIRLF